MRGIASVFLSTALVLFISGFVVPVLGSDVNWGKKVNCFVVDETVVCPGCNYRAGLSCPRKLKYSQNCLQPSTQPSFTTKSTSPPETTYEDIHLTESSFDEKNATEKNFLDFNSNLPKSNEIQKESSKPPLDMNIYLYRLLDASDALRYRFKREIEEQEEEEEEEPETCNWNGDCPCPLICCKTGPGCLKRCVMGIRLPPPWG